MDLETRAHNRGSGSRVGRPIGRRSIGKKAGLVAVALPTAVAGIPGVMASAQSLPAGSPAVAPAADGPAGYVPISPFRALDTREAGGRVADGTTIEIALADADPAAALHIDPILERLRERIQDPGYIQGLVRELLLDNPHRVRLVMRPDPNLSAEKNAAEQARLLTLKAAMDAEEQRRVIAQAEALKARQEQQDDPELLPKVTLADIPDDLHIPLGETEPIAGLPATRFARGTNGLVYEEVVIDLPALDERELELLPIYCDLVTEVGCGGRDYRETQLLQNAVTGGIGARVSVRGAVDDLHRQRGLFFLHGKALARNQGALAKLLLETFETPRFDEANRLRELISQERLDMEQGVTSRGHALAMTAASSGLTPSAALYHRWSGLAGIQAIKALDDALEDDAKLRELMEGLEALRERLRTAPKQLLVVAEAEQFDAIRSGLEAVWSGLDRPAGASVSPFGLPAPGGRVRQAWTTSTQVNFCAKSFPAVCREHPDAPALTILAPFLRNNFLHRVIREQGGAYGGGARFDPDTGAFRFYSYRDPRLGETLADFDRSVDWLLSNDHPYRLLEEAILGVIADIDKPGSPAGEAKRAFHEALHGRTPERRRAYRKKLLEVTLEDLKRVAETYLQGDQAGVAVISNAGQIEKAGLGLEAIAL